MRFVNWPFLLLLALIPLLHRWWSNRNRPARVRFSLPVPASVARPSPHRALLAIRYLGLDISQSMNIEDMSERSRMEVARETIEAFIKRRENDRIGLVIFSGEAV